MNGSDIDCPRVDVAKLVLILAKHGPKQGTVTLNHVLDFDGAARATAKLDRQLGGVGLHVLVIVSRHLTLPDKDRGEGFPHPLPLLRVGPRYQGRDWVGPWPQRREPETDRVRLMRQPFVWVCGELNFAK